VNAIIRPSGDGTAWLDMRAFVALMTGDPTGARELAVASLQVDPSSENRWLAGRSLRVLAAVEFGHE